MTTGEPLPNAAFFDIFETSFLAFVGASVAGSDLSCDLFEQVPDAVHTTVVCALGTIDAELTVRVLFEALAATVPDRTVDSAGVTSDPDGPGGAEPTTIGPVSDDVEIIDLAGITLPPLGDGSTAGSAGQPGPRSATLLLMLTVAALSGAAWRLRA